MDIPVPETYPQNDELFHIYPATSPPYKWICCLHIEAEDGKKYAGSGFKINVEPDVNVQVILTSAHGLYYKPGKLCKNVTVYFPDEEKQVATSANDQLWVCPEYIEKTLRGDPDYCQYDYGMITLPGDSSGGFGWNLSEDCNNRHKLLHRVVTTCGYSTKDDRNQYPPNRLLATGGAICEIDRPNRLLYTNDTCGGQSGGPINTWIKGHMTAVGIHAYGNHNAQFKSGCKIHHEMMEMIMNNIGVADWQNVSIPQ